MLRASSVSDSEIWLAPEAIEARVQSKLAVRLGGGKNHRTGLYDMILIEDNHIDFAGSLQTAVLQARAAKDGLQIEVHTRTLVDVRITLDVAAPNARLFSRAFATNQI